MGNLTPEQFSTAASEVIFLVFLPHGIVYRAQDDRKNGCNYTGFQETFIIGSYHEARSDRPGHVTIIFSSNAVKFQNQIEKRLVI